jgi:hypothetical protein
VCQQCNERHQRHDSVVSVQLARPERRARLLISAGRGFEPHPPHQPAVLPFWIMVPWTGLSELILRILSSAWLVDQLASLRVTV